MRNEEETDRSSSHRTTGSEEGKSNKEVSGALEKMGEVIDHAVINREGSKHRGTDTLRKDKG